MDVMGLPPTAACIGLLSLGCIVAVPCSGSYGRRQSLPCQNEPGPPSASRRLSLSDHLQSGQSEQTVWISKGFQYLEVVAVFRDDRL